MSDVKKRIIDYETAGEVNEDFYLLGDNGTEGTFKIPVKAVGPIESICPVYDAEAGTYDEGDYCFYDQKMYQCNTDISVPEDFDSTKWDEVTIAEIMASQQNQISTINQSLTQKKIEVLLSEHTIPTTATSYALSDDIDNYDFLIIQFKRFNNLVNVATVPVSYFKTTTSNGRVQIPLYLSDGTYVGLINTYYHDDTHVYMASRNSTTATSDYAVVICGVKV